MIKSRPAFTMPVHRPRRIWLNGVGAQNGSSKEEELRKSLPYCDTETGTKNRVVERDPISGLGLLGKEYDPLQENRQKTRSPRDKDTRNPILGKGNLGQEVNPFSKPEGYKSSRKSNNPLDQSTAEREVDTLQPKGRPGKMSILQARRDPISGRGEFGREWDPVYKYSGRPRPWHQRAQDDPCYYKLKERPLILKTDQRYIAGYYAKRGGRCNPVTGEDANSFDINRELKRTPRNGTAKKSNPVTGENCDSFTVSNKMNEKYMRTGAKKGAVAGNPVTGENCKSFDFNVESKPTTPRRPATQGGNPVTGENCTVYAYSSEFKAKMTKANVPQNPLTGENVKTYVLKLTEKDDAMPQARPRSPSESKNPVTGSNCPSFMVSQEERPRTAPSALSTPRSASNPVTGEGCKHYVLCTGEKKVSNSSHSKEASGNPLTGANMRSFDINKELRVNKRSNESSKPIENGHHTNGVSGAVVQTARSNPITG